MLLFINKEISIRSFWFTTDSQTCDWTFDVLVKSNEWNLRIFSKLYKSLRLIYFWVHDIIQSVIQNNQMIDENFCWLSLAISWP